MSRLLGSTTLAAIVLALAVTASAQDASPEEALAEIREMALYARYREALQATQTFLERGDLNASQRNTGLEVLATVHIALRDQSSATSVLQQLYARDPEHRLSDPDASPPVLSAFGRARSNPPPRIEVELAHTPPALQDRGPAIVEVRLGANADAVHEVRLRYRQGDDDQLSTLVMNVGDGVARARLPVLERSEAYTVEYFVEALAPSGATLTSLGTESEPLAFTMPAATVAVAETGPSEPAPAGGDDLWWVWTILGVALAAGAGVGIYFLVQELSAPQDGSLDTIQLPLVRF